MKQNALLAFNFSINLLLNILYVFSTILILLIDKRNISYINLI